MNNINWKQKLTSRKLWAALIAVAMTILTAMFKTELTAETVELIGKGVIALCVYIFGEGVVDAARLIWSHAVTAEPLVEIIEEINVDEDADSSDGSVDTIEYEK